MFYSDAQFSPEPVAHFLGAHYLMACLIPLYYQISFLDYQTRCKIGILMSGQNEQKTFATTIGYFWRIVVVERVKNVAWL